MLILLLRLSYQILARYAIDPKKITETQGLNKDERRPAIRTAFLDYYILVILCPCGVSFTRYPAAAKASRSSSLRFQFFSLRAWARSSAIC